MKASELHAEALANVNTELRKDTLRVIEHRLAEIARLKESLAEAEADLAELLATDVTQLDG